VAHIRVGRASEQVKKLLLIRGLNRKDINERYQLFALRNYGHKNPVGRSTPAPQAARPRNYE
jgi:hypothetical protein